MNQQVVVTPAALLLALLAIAVLIGVGILLWKSRAARWIAGGLGMLAVLGFLVIMPMRVVRVERVDTTVRRQALVELDKAAAQRDRRTGDGHSAVVQRATTRVAAPGMPGVAEQEQIELAPPPAPAEDAAPAPPPSSGDIAPRPGATTIAAPDDWSRWQRESVLDFADRTPSRAWVADAAGSRLVRETVGGIDFIYWKPGPEGRVVGYSTIEPTTAEAQRTARTIAADKLGLLALRELQARDPSFTPTALRARALAQRVAMEQGAFEEQDVVVQDAARPYASVYRAAMAAAADQPRLVPIVAELESEIRRGWIEAQQRASALVWLVASSLVIAAGIFFAYCLLNSGTKGYFAWPLRIASASALVILALAIYYVRKILMEGISPTDLFG